jgi:hypothetical protein
MYFYFPDTPRRFPNDAVLSTEVIQHEYVRRIADSEGGCLVLEEQKGRRDFLVTISDVSVEILNSTGRISQKHYR